MRGNQDSPRCAKPLTYHSTPTTTDRDRHDRQRDRYPTHTDQKRKTYHDSSSNVRQYFPADQKTHATTTRNYDRYERQHELYRINSMLPASAPRPPPPHDWPTDWTAPKSKHAEDREQDHQKWTHYTNLWERHMRRHALVATTSTEAVNSHEPPGPPPGPPPGEPPGPPPGQPPTGQPPTGPPPSGPPPSNSPEAETGDSKQADANELPTSTAMAFLNTINQHPALNGQESLATLAEIEESIANKCRTHANLALPDWRDSKFGHSVEERQSRGPLSPTAQSPREQALMDLQLDKIASARRLEQSERYLARLEREEYEFSATPKLVLETTESQPQGKFSVKSILSAPWAAEPTPTTTIATHLDALHHAAAHTATREATSKAMKFLLGHSRDSHSTSSCQPCLIMRAELEQNQPEHMEPFRQATAGATTSCLATLVELCNNIIESKSANPHSKRRACLTNASACFTRGDQAAIEMPALADAFLGAIIRQLAHADKGRYPATIHRTITSFTAASNPSPQESSISKHFLALARREPLPNLPDISRAFIQSLVRERASTNADSDWSKAADEYKLTLIPVITRTTRTLTRELQPAEPGPDRANPNSAWFHNTNGLVARWNGNQNLIKKTVADCGYPDVFTFLETKASWNTIIAKCPGFLEWLASHNYNFSYCSWSTSSRDESKNMSGFAGALTLSRTKPETVIYGLTPKEDQAGDARIITTIFKDVVIAAAYAPYNNQMSPRREARANWDSDAKAHCLNLQQRFPDRSFIFGGDLNVLPKDTDVDRGAFSNILRTLPSGAIPGRSPTDLEAYNDFLTTTSMLNVGEFTKRDNRLRTQWNSPAHKSADIGQNCDHILATRDLLSTRRDSSHIQPARRKGKILQITAFHAKHRLGGRQGQSDHCPIGIDLAWIHPRTITTIPGDKDPPPTDATSEIVMSVTERSAGLPANEIKLIGRPILKLQIVDHWIYALFDTGSFHTIFNPLPGRSALNDPVFGPLMAKRASYLKQVTLSGIGGNAITTNRCVEVPIQIKGVTIWIKGLILPTHCPHMPRAIIGLSDQMYRLGGFAIELAPDDQGQQRQLQIQFPKLGISVTTEGNLMQPDERIPKQPNIEDDIWNLAAFVGLHQGRPDCSTANCHACHYQPEAECKTEQTAPASPTDKIFLCRQALPDPDCTDCIAVANGHQLVCPVHGEASAIFLTQADTEAHLTLEDTEEDNPDPTASKPKAKKAKRKRTERKSARPPTPAPDAFALKQDKLKWAKLSLEEQGAAREADREHTREGFIETNLCSDIPMAVFTGTTSQAKCPDSTAHSTSFIYDGHVHQPHEQIDVLQLHVESRRSHLDRHSNGSEALQAHRGR